MRATETRFNIRTVKWKEKKIVLLVGQRKLHSLLAFDREILTKKHANLMGALRNRNKKHIERKS